MGAIPSTVVATGTITLPRAGNGVTITDTYGEEPETNSGCPFCHSMNPSGTGRDSDPFYSNTRNVENL